MSSLLPPHLLASAQSDMRFMTAKKVLVYTDASCAKNHDDNRVRREGLGVIVVHCENRRAYRSSLPCPAWLLNLFEDRKTKIGPFEVLAFLCTAQTFRAISYQMHECGRWATSTAQVHDLILSELRQAKEAERAGNMPEYTQLL